MIVPLLNSGPDSSGINPYFDRGIAWIFRIEFKGALNVFEMPAGISHHHVPGTKLGGGVSGLKRPFNHY
jgi:hypothetical protein